MKHTTSQRRQRRYALIHCGLAALGLSAVANRCVAADRSWTNTAGGVFSTASNWQNGLFAGVSDVANFNNSTLFGQQNYTITFSSIAQNQALKVKNDFVTFDLSGRTYTTTQLSGNESRYYMCFRAGGPGFQKQKMITFFGGQINQYVNATGPQCAAAAYQPFTELVTMVATMKGKK